MSAPVPSPDTEAAGAMPLLRRIIRHAAFETRVLLTNGEQLVVALVIPALVFLGLTLLPVGRVDGADPSASALAATFTTAILSSSFTSQSIQTGFDRRGGVLTWMATSPLGRDGYVIGKILGTWSVQILQIAVLATLALSLGWRPESTVLLAFLPVWILISTTWGALGMLLAGTLRTEAVLALSNTVFLLVVAVGGVVAPASSYPTGLATFVSLLPSSSAADLMRAALGVSPWHLSDALITLLWCTAGLGLVTRFFRWTSR